MAQCITFNKKDFLTPEKVDTVFECNDHNCDLTKVIHHAAQSDSKLRDAIIFINNNQRSFCLNQVKTLMITNQNADVLFSAHNKSVESGLNLNFNLFCFDYFKRLKQF